MKPPAALLGALALLLSLLAAAPAAADDAPYDRQFVRLAEVLGSVHYLRRLCGEEDGAWRAHMEALIETEEPSAEHRARLIASFNHGYRSFAAVYSRCTESAVMAIERYMKEGETLTRDLAQRYGS